MQPPYPTDQPVKGLIQGCLEGGGFPPKSAPIGDNTAAHYTRDGNLTSPLLRSVLNSRNLERNHRHPDPSIFMKMKFFHALDRFSPAKIHSFPPSDATKTR